MGKYYKIIPVQALYIDKLPKPVFVVPDKHFSS